MSTPLTALGVIPARLGSSRLPRKVLAPLLGKPMIQWVWEAAQRSQRLDRVLVATDSPEVLEVVRRFGGEACLTVGDFVSGTDRVAAAVEAEASDETQVIVNLQGDEPALCPSAVDALVDALSQGETGMATLAVRQSGTSDLLADPNVVKVVFNVSGEALYFSRLALAVEPDGTFFKHVGVYGFRREVLRQYVRWEPSELERRERLEQLRALVNGVRIQVVVVEQDTVAVDTARDIERAERYLKGLNQKGLPGGVSL